MLNAHTQNRFSWEDVEQQLTKHGVTKKTIDDAGGIDNFLNGRKTSLINVNYKGQDENITNLKGKLYIVDQPNSGARVFIQPERKEFKCPSSFLGYKFTDEDKYALYKHNNLGKKVILSDKVTGKPFEGYIGVDPDTKSLTVYKASQFKIPKILKGVHLTEQQQQALADGKAVFLSGLKSNLAGGKDFSAYAQIDPSRRTIQFSQPAKLKSEYLLNHEVSENNQLLEVKKNLIKDRSENIEVKNNTAQKLKKNIDEEKIQETKIVINAQNGISNIYVDKNQIKKHKTDERNKMTFLPKNKIT